MLGSSKNTLGPLNIFRTLIRHPELYRRFNQFAHQVLFKSSLSPRERELVVLRVGWLCGSDYEFHQHRSIGKDAGISDAEIERIKLGAQAPGWSSDDALLLQAVDELHRDHVLSDALWQPLSARYSTQQLMDFLFLVGNYAMLAMVLNTLGVQIEGPAPQART
jgi:4-carboxymuconolactone decarboxylase